MGERSDLVADLKSGGVTSETNQGMSFGLEVASIGCSVDVEGHHRNEGYALEDDFGDVWRVRHEEVREHEVGEQLRVGVGIKVRFRNARVRLTSNPAGRLIQLM